MEDVKYIHVCGHFLSHILKFSKLDLYSLQPPSLQPWPPTTRKLFRVKIFIIKRFSG
jgi:hypothetical protein